MRKHGKMTIRMAYEMVMPYHLHMPSYFLETFTEYPYIPLAGSYHSRGMWYFRLYELNPLSFVCFVCLSISGPGVVRIWIFGIPYLSEFIPRLSVIGRRRIIRIRNYIRREAGMRAIISSQHPTSLIWQSDCTHSNDAASPSAGKPG